MGTFTGCFNRGDKVALSLSSEVVELKTTRVFTVSLRIAGDLSQHSKTISSRVVIGKGERRSEIDE